MALKFSSQHRRLPILRCLLSVKSCGLFCNEVVSAELILRIQGYFQNRKEEGYFRYIPKNNLIPFKIMVHKRCRLLALWAAPNGAASWASCNKVNILHYYIVRNKSYSLVEAVVASTCSEIRKKNCSIGILHYDWFP